MGRRQQHLYRTEHSRFPPDFPERLADFCEAADLSWRELARSLQVNVRSVHRWRTGAKPGAGHLIALLNLAAELGLLGLLLPSADGRASTHPERLSPRRMPSPDR
ncbi:MAG: hypothetical protein OXT70_12930 [Chloroflexota bacterium]|nr:hypothetical protein [Chloroflexota bacterium]